MRHIDSHKPIYALDIHGKGEIVGKATISLVLNGKPYKIEKLNGAVRFEWSGDWYSDTAEIHYQPTDVSSGALAIEYRFHAL